MPRRAQPHPLSLLIGQRVRALREAAHLTLEGLAFESEIGSKGHLSDLERGLLHPTVQTLERLAQRLDVQLLDLVIDPQRDPRHALVDVARELSPRQVRALLDEAKAMRDAPAKPAAPAPPLPFTVIDRRDERAVPLLPLDVAAGGFTPGAHGDEVRWVRPRTRKRLQPGHFVARVVGRSMAPRVPDGSYALFFAPVRGDPEGRTLLLRCPGMVDDDTGASYTLKRFTGERGPDGAWARVTLVPENRDFAPITLDLSSGARFDAVAELVEVLAPTDA